MPGWTEGKNPEANQTGNICGEAFEKTAMAELIAPHGCPRL